MFETAELGNTLSKEEYHQRVPVLRTTLIDVQNRLKSAPFPVIVVFAGVEGAGKGETLAILNEWLDPRFLATHSVEGDSDEERERPEFWRYWRRLPARGRIAIFLGSWYNEPLRRRFLDKIDDAGLANAMQRIRTFEGELAADGALILKYWFHLGKQAEKKRLKSLKKDPSTRWRVRPIDRQFVKHYEPYRVVSEQTLRLTSTAAAPWTIVDSSDARYRHITVGEHLAAALARRLQEVPARPAVTAATPVAAGPRVSILDRLDLTQRLEDGEYKVLLERYQGRLHELCRKVSQRGVASVLVFEGWDAGGKGGVVRRVVGGMDARDFTIVPVAAPTDEEKAHHYLWRFWRHLPRDGRVTIFDRSWYGRVLVERVENFAREDEWRRAYEEINDFEQQLVEHGNVLLKFWLHLDKEEQMRRFKEREQTPFKQYKIGPEDWRNRAKWDEYDLAVNEMVERCSTELAPWTLVEANDKRFARIKVLKTFCDRLEARL